MGQKRTKNTRKDSRQYQKETAKIPNSNDREYPVWTFKDVDRDGKFNYEWRKCIYIKPNDLAQEELSKMFLVNDTKLLHYPFEDLQKYCVFDEDGFMTGVKDDAPSEFKEAYEWDKKRAEEWWAKGID